MSENHWTKTLERAVAFLMTLIMGFIAWESTKWSTSIETLSGNVASLNTKMEVVVTELSNSADQFNHLEHRVEDHEIRIRKVEVHQR